MTTTIIHPSGFKSKAKRKNREAAPARKQPSRVQYKMKTDDELVALTRGGDPSAFDELITRYQKKVTNLALKITKNENDAQEVVQEVFLNAYCKLSSFKGTAAFSSWLYRVAANGALMLLRSRKKDVYELWECGALKADSTLAVPAEWSVRADSAMERKQLAGVLLKEFNALPERYRDILMMREIEGFSNKDISQELNLSVAAVKSRLHRARLMLRKRLTNQQQVPPEVLPFALA